MGLRLERVCVHRIQTTLKQRNHDKKNNDGITFRGNVRIVACAEHAFGNSNVEISSDAFEAGMYVYTLVVDAQIADSKHMILTKGDN